MFKLLVTHSDPQQKFEVQLNQTEVRIGRAPEGNDIVLNDSRISRGHAVLRRIGRTYMLKDLGSANGTFVNGERVGERILNNKDVISMGSYTLLFDQQEVKPDIQFDSQKIGNTILMRRPDQVGLAATQSPPPLPPGTGGARLVQDDTAPLRKAAETLSRLYELSQMLSSIFSLEDIFKKVGELIFRTTPADRFVVLLKGADSDELSPFATEFRNPESAPKSGKITISKTVLDRVLSERMSLLSFDAQADARLEGALSLVMQQVHSVMCAPLLGKDKVLGVIYVDCQQQMKMFSADDLDMLNAIAAQTSMAVDNAVTHDQLLKEALARATYGRFMPRHVVEQILANPNALSLGGTNQVVTTLFSDIRGFTTMAESLPPEIIVQILNKYFADMTPLVFEHRGLLDKYIGDGMMALFGVPYQSEDAAVNAVSAAVAMQRRMVTLNRELKAEGLPEIAIGIGINTGTVTVGYIGSEQRTDYTAIGDNVNLAARLEKQAEPWKILISHCTLESLKGRFTVKPFGEIRVKGKSIPVQVYEVDWQSAS